MIETRHLSRRPLVGFLLLCVSAACSPRQTEELVLWGEGAPPGVEEIGYPLGIEHVRVHAADGADSGEYTFLLGAAVVEHQSSLFVSWANGMANENDAATQVTRGRRSADGGRTWSEPFVIAPAVDDKPGYYHAHGSFLSAGDVLYALIPMERMEGKSRPGLTTRLFRYMPEQDGWRFERDLIKDFYPMDEPRQRADGRWVMGGIDDESKPAVAISSSVDPAKPWSMTQIASVPEGFETSVWVEGPDVTAFIRNRVPDERGDLYLAAVRSVDGGESWGLAQPVNVPKSRLPAVDSKVSAGRLSNGQGYLVYNMPVGGNGQDRRILVIAVTAPGGEKFERVFVVRAFGEDGPRTVGHYKGVGWQYPYAHEANGKLYIVYARAKEDCELSIVPIEALAVDAGSTPIPAEEFPRPYFTRHYAVRSLGAGTSWGQTALMDLDRDGDLDFVTGLRGGDVSWFEYKGRGPWERHTLGTESPSDVGAAAADVNGDGWIDLITGGVWYENPQKPREQEFGRHVFDADLATVHDVAVGDIDGDGKDDVVTMSDKNDLRWYAIAADPVQPWTATRIYDSVHSGIALGDLDADGDMDIVRSNIWLENLDHGKRWGAHQLTEPWGDHSFAFSYNATRAAVADIDADGRNDIVLTDGEMRGPRVGWLKAPADPRDDRAWTLRYLAQGDSGVRGPYHSLQVADFDNDGDLDVFTAEMEHIGGDRPPRWFVWENTDGAGAFVEKVVLNANLGGHEARAGDVDGDGDIDICAKPWAPAQTNANGGRAHFDFLENLTVGR